ncbi:hypothetical protein N7466_003557 [Penicillium verhagenii]|uniref:uncharacterized protein n=1 Tax=Penicillium verhagenii TaxID=1562060 RepID=UPI0025459BCC|nr:uncharacterized protein N7466_003557 [Penicillium verhagenii]KAJ5937107.1 hypothetical protein N7466_003557 [Penicillium verhagenii]
MERLQSKQPIRVCICLTQSNPYWDEPPELVLEKFLGELGCDLTYGNDANLLVEQKWNKRIFLIYDFFHANYNYETAHLQTEAEIPVLQVDSRRTMIIRSAGPAFQARVNGDVRQIHNLNGYTTKPPYIDDHSGGNIPVHKDPRDTSLLMYNLHH